MLDSDTFFSDSGELTKQGAANIALINMGLNAEQQKIADYRAQLVILFLGICGFLPYIHVLFQEIVLF